MMTNEEIQKRNDEDDRITLKHTVIGVIALIGFCFGGSQFVYYMNSHCNSNLDKKTIEKIVISESDTPKVICIKGKKEYSLQYNADGSPILVPYTKPEAESTSYQERK